MKKQIGINISIIIPAYNEREVIPLLYDRLNKILSDYNQSYEMIFVNDGSTDGTGEVLADIQRQSPTNTTVIHLRRNCGKAVALRTGFNIAAGQIIVMIDADLQDQPEDIPRLLDYMKQQNLDAVSGWKINRFDPGTKIIGSRIFNWVLRKFTGLKLHDFNCGLKAFRREAVQNLNLYGQMHRFIMIFIHHLGFKVGEIPVKHCPRKYGISKYGTLRIYHGWMDLITVFFITRYLYSPSYFFGFYATWTLLIAFVVGCFFVGMHTLFVIGFIDNPGWRLNNHSYWLISPIFFMISLMFMFFGLIGELFTFYFTNMTSHGQFIGQINRPQNDELSETPHINEG